MEGHKNSDFSSLNWRSFDQSNRLPVINGSSGGNRTWGGESAAKDEHNWS